MLVCQRCILLFSEELLKRQRRVVGLMSTHLQLRAMGMSVSGGHHNSLKKEANNPLLAANRYLQHPIFEDKDIIFRPTEMEVEEAGKLFENGRNHKVAFAKGAFYPEQAPDYNIPEIAMIGHSNVGKSSLIKALFSNVPGLTVRTSKTPGHTKLLLFYQAGKAFGLVDLPGYGVRQPQNFAVTAQGYLRTRKNLQMLFLLVDIRAGFKPLDFTAIEMLEDFSRPYSLIITKADSISPRKLVTSLLSIRDTLNTKTSTCLPQPFLVSATKMKGISFMRSYIAYLTGNVRVSDR
ncbi:GTP-binding protein 8-like [Lytechinus pictus]|uniref:GTP-binding protein 8-like n=1 Tax=Lytechinus pictus TaxID=7653 RepID=UPI0030BA053E